MQKLQSIGTLAGGIAHDYNNILMGLFGNISLAKEELPKDHPAYHTLGEAEKAMNRAVRLTKQLLTFAKGGEPVKENANLGVLADEITRFDLSGSNVHLVFHQAADLWTAEIDKGQIQQVLSNLTINARQAMPNGGHLTVTLENEYLVDRALASLPA
jgi:signal transduction histidine kinase